MSTATLHRGHVFHVAGNPAVEDAPAALREHPDGGLLVDTAGRIVACGSCADLDIPDGTIVENHRGAYLLPGFVDGHVHFPQVYSPAAWSGGQLLEWLDGCVFPAEARLADPAFARQAAAEFTDALVRAGTTCALIYGSQFPGAQEALVAEIAGRGLRAIVGRTAMVCGPASAAPLLTTAAEAVRLAREEVERWHPPPEALDTALLHVAVIPRYALNLTPDGLRAFGEFYAELQGRGVYLSTHLSENDRPGDGEVDEVRATFGVRQYLDVYDGLFLPGSGRGGESLLGPRSVFAHAVHCSDDELARLAATRSSIVHCPTSQLFLGSGTMPWRRTRRAGAHLGLGSDVGAGETFSIAEVAATCFKVHRSEPHPEGLALHPAELLHLATLGGAQALALDHRIGNFDAGKEADFLVVAPEGDPLLARRLESAAARGPAAHLFTLLFGLPRAMPQHVFVRGRDVLAT